ncbi:ribosome 60S biogenesis N-terminal-domain-containing protein [Schizophyllum amplum]|uniref:Ribosome 60S biogenesis N-terminal-domain-containing protein n=1 Tax=Schizophyllum amplum TaxID=97359 RepID=A0A550CDF5_9AGAR|nr:ribosome 60S biogenesis N-terminal-domain-containing protein [Auriculariopsis ampla]
MPRHTGDAVSEPPRKRQRTETTETTVFRTAHDARNALRAFDPDTVTRSLTALRNQLTIKAHEEKISAQDARLALVDEFLQLSPGAQDVLQLWEASNPRQPQVPALCCSVLACMLTLLSSHLPYHGTGMQIVKSLLQDHWTRRVMLALSGSSNDLVLATLKLLNAMAGFASGRERKAVLEQLTWEGKLLPKLLNMRRRSKPGEDTVDALTRPDIRTLTMLLISSPLTTPSPYKAAFLEQHVPALALMLKGIPQDPTSVVKHVLEMLWEGLWCDPKVKRTLKVALFGETTMGHLLKLYDSPSEDTRDVLHHFLLAICTRPGTGVCFRDRGWYPREDHSDGSTLISGNTPASSSNKIHNRILAHLLKQLRPTEDPRQHELALRILSACPELVTGYWGAAGLTLEPRLSSRWITNVAFAGEIVALPVPTDCLYLREDRALANPVPPPLNAIIAAIIPGGSIMKSHWTKGLQYAKALVQHSSALSLAKSLTKYAAVLRAFDDVGDGGEGAWAARRAELEGEVRRRVPEFSVIVGLSRAGDAQKDDAQHALIGEVAARLLWLYHHVLPGAVREVRVDVGRALVGMGEATAAKHTVGEEVDVAARLRGVQQLHVLRLLQDTEDFVWWSKPAGSPHTYLHIFLKGTVTATLLATRIALRDLTCHLLAQSILFQETPHEPSLWLACLPSYTRLEDTQAPDGTPLTSELDAVVTFLDDCVQRCLKTPYRYMDDLRGLMGSDSAELPSALLATVLEQARHKTLSPSDTLAVATFVRRLLIRLSTTSLQAPDVLCALQSKLDEIWSEEKLWAESPVMTRAVRREVAMMGACLARDLMSGEDSEMDSEAESDAEVRTLVREIEQAGDDVPSTMAVKVMDLLRLSNPWISATDTGRIAVTMDRLHCLQDFAEALPPSCVGFDGLDAELYSSLPFEWLFVHARLEQLSDDYRRKLIAAIGADASAYDVRRGFCFILQYLASSKERSPGRAPLLHTLADLVMQFVSAQQSKDAQEMKSFILGAPALVDICTSAEIQPEEKQAIARLVSTLRQSGEQDSMSAITGHWSSALTTALESQEISGDIVKCASPWLPHVPTNDLVHIFDLVMSNVNALDQDIASLLISSVLAAMGQASDDSVPAEIIASRATELLSLRATFSDRALLDSLLARTISRSIPLAVNGALPGRSSLSALTHEAEQRWRARLTPLPALAPDALLDDDSWDDSVVQIISGLIYKGQIPEPTFVAWLRSDKCSSRTVDHLATVLGAFADSRSANVPGMWESMSPHAIKMFKAILRPSVSPDARRHLADFLGRLLGGITSLPASFGKSAASAVQKPTSVVTSDLIRIFEHDICSGADDLLGVVIERALRDLVEYLADERGEKDDVRALISALHHVLVKHPSAAKTHSVETLLTAVLQHALTLPHVLLFASELVQRVILKPVVVNRNIQAIVQNPKFQRAAATSSPSREALVKLLYTLFQTHPTNTCQVTHVEPLLQIYRGTLSTSDRRILAIFQLFEEERNAPITSLLSRWSSSSDLPSQTALEAVQSLDPILVLRTCLSYPKWRELSNPVDERVATWEEPLYDPVFLMLLFAQMILECPPSSALAWVDMFRTNIVSLLIRMMSARDDELRELAANQLSSLWLCLEGTDMQEKDHVVYVLSLLKDTLPRPEVDGVPKRLPTYTTLIFAHALRAIFYPTNFIYPLTARFLLQRPLLDVDDVPMLYGMLYSSNDDWKKERGWILKFLADGMCGTDDWRVFRRRHTWDLLASMFQSSPKDRALRSGVLEVLANLTSLPQAVTSLVLKSGLLPWIEMQTRDAREEEAVAWVCILENCLTLADAGRAEAATHGEWRGSICRCLTSIVKDAPSARKSFPMICRATLHLSLLPGSPVNGLQHLISAAIYELGRLEERLEISSGRLEISSGSEPPASQLLSPPHRAASLHEEPAVESIYMWARCVKDLWMASMQVSNELDWSALTSRLVLCRVLAPGAAGVEAEWARKETVALMLLIR